MRDLLCLSRRHARGGVRMGFITIKTDNCAGCKACELSCSLKHYGYFDCTKSRIKILRDGERWSVAIQQCIQCNQKFCIAACPTNALSLDSSLGCIQYDAVLCISCKKCFKTCPHHGVQWDEEHGQPLICDLCGGDPECLKPCRLHGALTRNSKEA